MTSLKFRKHGIGTSISRMVMIFAVEYLRNHRKIEILILLISLNVIIASEVIRDSTDINSTTKLNMTNSIENISSANEIPMPHFNNFSIYVNNTYPKSIFASSNSSLVFSPRNDSSIGCAMVNSTSGERRSYKLLIACDEKYIAVVFNWLAFYLQSCQTTKPLYFVCLDKQTEFMLNAFGLRCAHIVHTMSSHHKLWLYRVRITKHLLEQGYDVLMSDADAVWLRNPFLLLQEFEDSDIIGQRASFPEPVAKILGATLCMGFVYVRSTIATKLLWNDLANSLMRSKIAPDDQKSLNYLLKDKGLRFPKPLQYVGTTNSDTGSLNYKMYNMKITLLPHESIRRICDNITNFMILNSTIVHCLLRKKKDYKIYGQKRYGVWYV